MQMQFHEICFQLYTPEKIMYGNINDNQWWRWLQHT